jgi:hypothetical protein
VPPACPVGASNCGAGTIFNANTCMCDAVAPPNIPPQNPPNGGNSGQAQAEQLVASLEAKIDYAQRQGIDAGTAVTSLYRAVDFLKNGSFVESAVEAQKGIIDIENRINSAGKNVTYAPAPTMPLPPADTNMLIVVAAGGLILILIILGAIFLAGLLGLGGLLSGIYLLFGRKKPEEKKPDLQPPAQSKMAPKAKRKK